MAAAAGTHLRMNLAHSNGVFLVPTFARIS
jgi:hypothetical protein